VFNISALSFGALSANAILALNRGALAGGLPRHRRRRRQPLPPGTRRRHYLEIGSGYFGCRMPDGASTRSASPSRRARPVKMIEIKLSQGAKPGHGGCCGAKVSLEIARRAACRRSPIASRRPCTANFRRDRPARIRARLRELADGKPGGLEDVRGPRVELFAIAKAMLATGIAPDFIVVDGPRRHRRGPGEFVDHVECRCRRAAAGAQHAGRAEPARARAHRRQRQVITAFDIARTLAIGADWCNSARGFMFALGACRRSTATWTPARRGSHPESVTHARAGGADKAERCELSRNTLKALAS